MRANGEASAPQSWRSRLPSLGLGAAGIGNLYEPVAEAVAIDTIAAAFEASVRYLDTAPHYGFGLSESRIGIALGELDPAGAGIISTKVGRRLEPLTHGDAASVRHGFAAAAPFEPVFDYSYDGVRDRFGVPLAAAALQFPLAHPQVTCVVPGMARREHIDTMVALAKHAIPAELWHALREDGLLPPQAPAPDQGVAA